MKIRAQAARSGRSGEPSPALTKTRSLAGW